MNTTSIHLQSASLGDVLWVQKLRAAGGGNIPRDADGTGDLAKKQAF